MENNKISNIYTLGIDIGSTTAKVVILDPEGQLVHSAYRRHHAETLRTLRELLSSARDSMGDVPLGVTITGSAGLGISETYDLPFVQEVIASARVARQLYPQARSLMDIGGEDAKLIFFDAHRQPDIRMNGACAGGTGAFIDQMASLLNISLDELNNLALQAEYVHSIASRCGVFAKTDVQNLLSRDVPPTEIAASVFHAVVWQTLATLARGRELQAPILFLGGPLTFLSALKQAFIEGIELLPGDWIDVPDAALFPAHGAALTVDAAWGSLSSLIDLLSQPRQNQSKSNRLPVLFSDEDEFNHWQEIRAQAQVAKLDINDPREAASVAGAKCFLGIDSGSTTTKLVLIDEKGRISFDFYGPNKGNAIAAVQTALKELREYFAKLDNPPKIIRSMVTGYGEDLIRAAFGLDDGLVETIAHYRAARAFDPKVSFILDIGGQDMKAIFVNDGHIQRIEINEACSSGCGTFVESFAHSLGREVADFAEEACSSQAPCDLGTRCTVFMNSRVKQALREGAEVRDISAGLAYSVIKNALHKVLKLTDTSILGEHVVVQGGSFRNPAIQRALEKILERPVICPDKAELMGAYGAALTARDDYRDGLSGVGLGIGLDNLEIAGQYQKRNLRCRACENQCSIIKLTFPNKNVFYTGNRCERVFTNRGEREMAGENMFSRKRELLFKRPMQPEGTAQLTIGLPRALNLYENFPFWCTLFVESGINVRLSDPSSAALCEKGAGSVMSENICFPAKLLHGHILNLIDAGVDRIFYPMVFYEKREFEDSVNCYNCPVVTGYPDVVKSAINPEGRYGVPFDKPAVSFQLPGLLKQTCREYLSNLGISERVIDRAFRLAMAAQEDFKTEVRSLGAETLSKAQKDGRLTVVLAGRPYHLDALVNHKIPEILSEMGVNVLTEDSIPLEEKQHLENDQVLTQWEFLNRIYHAARWVANQPQVELAQLNSFGCGPDAFAVDEVKGILEAQGKNHTVIRIDEIDSTGSARLRLRSMMEAYQARQRRSRLDALRRVLPRITTRVYRRETDHRKTILVPEFSRFCSPPIIRPVIDLGFRIEVLPSPTQSSVQTGLKYTNNEICYPGIIVIGDTIKALQSGNYDLDDVIVGSWETGGQCRASNISCLTKKAMTAAGFEDIPLVTLSTRLKSINSQEEFKFNIMEYLYKAMLGMIYSDGISALYHASAVRERTKGDATTLADKFLQPFESGEMPLNRRTVMDGLRGAVKEFNSLALDKERRPQVGIVGEIYVKYNTFVNNNLVQWLMDRDVEVVLPPLLTFFSGSFIGFRAGIQGRIRRRDPLYFLAGIGQRLVKSVTQEAEVILDNFRHYHPKRAIQEVAETASRVLELTHQYGEGWLLSGEIGEYARSGINNVICLQPFGCIANHVIAKGMAKRLQETYENLNLLFLDLDAGISDVNYVNRLHFLVEQAKEAG